MKKLIATVCTLVFAGAFQAGAILPEPLNWCDPATWHDSVPTPSSTVQIPTGVVITIPSTCSAICGNLALGDNYKTGTLIIDGGTLLTTDSGWSAIGYNSSASMNIQNGGEWNCSGWIYLGATSAVGLRTNILTLYSGAVNMAGSLLIGTGFTASETHSLAKVTLYGGTITTPVLTFGATAPPGTAIVEIWYGDNAKIVLQGDQTASVASWISQGKMIPRTAHPDEGVYIQAIFDGTKTTVFAMPGHAPDLDADGIPDSWEEQYFGGPTAANPDAICSNGVNTIRQAYIAGLNPNDPDSQFMISVLQSPSGSILGWNAVSGRIYSVYFSTNLLSGFQPLETPPPHLGCFTDVIHSAQGQMFYKVDVQLEDNSSGGGGGGGGIGGENPFLPPGGGGDTPATPI